MYIWQYTLGKVKKNKFTGAAKETRRKLLLQQ
jgi:hypothetical protein